MIECKLKNKWFDDPFKTELVVIGEPEIVTDEEGNIEYVYKVRYKDEEKNKKKVFCKVQNGLGWVYSGHPEQVYKVGNNYEMLDEHEPREFERYATSFDI